MFFFFQAEDGIRDGRVTGVQTCALPIFRHPRSGRRLRCRTRGWSRQGGFTRRSVVRQSNREQARPRVWSYFVGMSAAGRALRVLEYLAATAQPVSNQELGSALGIPRSTLSDLLAELRALGYVHQVGGGHVPGTALTLLGYRMTRRLGTPGEIQRSLAQLAQSTGETAIY